MNNADDIDGPTKPYRQRRRRTAQGPDAPTGAKRARATARTGRRSTSPADHRREFDRYSSLAWAALSSGDAIEAENLHQHADHHLREMNQPRTPSR